MNEGNRIPEGLLDEVKAVFKNHNYPGTVIGRRSQLADPGANNCPPGTTPHDVTYQLPDGTWVTKTMCLPT